jgi:hypothetical protein
MANDTAALRKRSQIAKANRTMFIWIAASSAVIGVAIVLIIFLAQNLVYNEKLLAEKNKTISTLDANNAAIPDLQSEVRVLDTNTALSSAKANEDDQTLRVILDALPSEANSLALGASLQSKLLSGISGLVVESLQVDPIVGVESLSDGAVVDAAGGVTSYEILFQSAVSGSPEALEQVLQNLERSIRLIDVQTLRIETQGDGQLMTINARAFYEPARTLELTDKVVPR